MKAAALPVLALLVSLGCQSRDATHAPPAPPPPEPTGPHQFVIERGVIRYHGNSLTIGAPLERWFAALGPPSRDITPGHRFVVWDEIGIYVRVIDGLTQEFGVYLQPRIPPIEASYVPFLPARSFTGRLVVDGWRIHKNTDPSEVRNHFAEWRRDNLRQGYRYDYSNVEPPISGYLDSSGTGGTSCFVLAEGIRSPKRRPE